MPVCILSCVRLFATPWTVVHRAPLSIAFSRQECSSGLPFPSSGDLSNLGVEPESLVSPALKGKFFTYIAHILFLLENSAHGAAMASTPAGAAWPQPSLAFLSVKVFRWVLKVKAFRHPYNSLQVDIRVTAPAS